MTCTDRKLCRCAKRVNTSPVPNLLKYSNNHSFVVLKMTNIFCNLRLRDKTVLNKLKSKKFHALQRLLVRYQWPEDWAVAPVSGQNVSYFTFFGPVLQGFFLNDRNTNSLFLTPVFVIITAVKPPWSREFMKPAWQDQNYNGEIRLHTNSNFKLL